MTTRPADKIYTEPDRTGREPEVTELVLDWDRENGGGMHVVRLTPRDREGVLAALAGPQPVPLYPTWAAVAGDEARYAGVLSPEEPMVRYQPGGQKIAWLCSHGHAGRGEAQKCAADELNRRLWAGGYALAVQDCLETDQQRGNVVDYLERLHEKIDDEDGDVEEISTRLIFLTEVIKMLREP